MGTNKLLLLILALILASSTFTTRGFAQTVDKSELDELKQMIQELKKDNEEKTKEIEALRKENTEKIQALENRINKLGEQQDKPKMVAEPYQEHDEEEEEERKDEFYSNPDEYTDSYSFFDRLDKGEKPYKTLVSKGPFHLEWGGYADLLASWYNHGPDQTRPGGSESDSRLEFDLARFVLELEGEMFAGIGFEAEIEFEHGGTGSTLEIEYEEFGEFEQEIEKGGEVIIEELYLSKKFSDWGLLKAGRFYLAFGLLQFLNRPTDYLAARRPEAELSIIPAVWDEIGVSFEYDINRNWNVTGQIVNGLDSAYFGSLGFVRDGQQGKFEFIRADGLAFVGRVDYKLPDWGLLVGSSIYYGLNTNSNRPEDDLEGVDSPLLLVDAHSILQHDRWRGSGVVIYGHLWNADEISERNARLPNNSEAPRTAVSDNALGAWGELGYNINTYVGLDYLHRLEPFVRVDYYDTMYNPRKTLFDNPRFERTVLTGGLSYTFANSVFVKLDYGYRIIAASDLRNESTVNLAWGFVY